MESSSILLPLTGSQESLYAAELAWDLAKKTGAKVTAQHVIDTRGSLEFISPEKPGLIGSGLYVAAYESICQSLEALAIKLENSYNSRAASLGISTDFVVDKGDPAEEICKRANDCNLIIMGHRPRGWASNQGRQFVKPSLAEKLAYKIKVPLLIVQEPIRTMTDFAIFASMDHANTKWIKTCMQSVQAIGASCRLTFLPSKNHAESPADFIANLRQANPELDNADIRVANTYLEALQDRGRHLIVIPTIDAGNQRITGVSQSPSQLIQDYSFGALLLWPEEFRQPLFTLEPVVSAST